MRLFAIVILSLVVYSVSGATLESQVKLGNATKNNTSVTSVSQVKLNNNTAEAEVEVITDTTETVAQNANERVEELLKEIQEILANSTPSVLSKPPFNLPKPPCHKPQPSFNLPRPLFGLPRPPIVPPRPPFGFPPPPPPPRPHTPFQSSPLSGFGPPAFINQNERFGGRFGGNPGFGFRQNW